MSAFSKDQTIYKDRECLVAALGDMGYTTVEVHDVAQQLYDYHGHATHYIDAKGDKANVIVRRNYVGGAANDLGFKLEADGTYSAIISAFDRNKHNDAWKIGLKGKYSERVGLKTAKRLGLKPYKTQVNAKGQRQILWVKA